MSGQSHSLSYVVDVKANISSVKGLASQIQNSLNNLTLPKGMSSQFVSEFDKLFTNLRKYEQIVDKGLPQNKKGMSAANSAWEGVESTIGRIQTLMGQLNAQELKLLPKNTQSDLEKINNSLKEYKNLLSEIQQKQDYKTKKDALSKQVEKHEALTKRQKQLNNQITTKTTQQQAAKAQLNQLGFSDADLANYESKILQLEQLQNKLKNAINLKGTEQQNAAFGGLNLKSLTEAQNKLIEVNNQLELLRNYKNASKGIQTDSAELGVNQADITNTLNQIERLKAELSSLETAGAGAALNNVLKQIATLTGTDVSKFAGDLQKAQAALDNFRSDQLVKATTNVEGAKGQIEALVAAMQQGTTANRQFNNSFNQMLTREQDMANFISRFSYFFSLTGITQTMRRAIRDVTNTIKELDSVMTETAVVTDFTISDMWDKLPDYTKKASALGTSIKSLYEATTLYYQQGLNEQAAMDIGIETMKMARIANMDASDATQAMTAALRGFNMEIDKTSATRVNDVYSKLAAITASDTESIATAMSKTASIASSANMEFEATAAFLAQIIETTQEAPETAGTAMKTIIARFTEVKKLFSEGMLSGKDEEGEAIEINKIDKALQSVGISLKSFLRGEKGIDDIFLELASKWDTLDLATQRYIATTAAGSRQQSRFIAMMSDYGRTMELVEAAQNSGGASQEQFDKTLDSLSSKMERLKNAWHEFTMGIIDSDLVKTGIDMLTKLLETVNKITNAFGKVGGPLAKIGVIMAGFKLGRGLFMRTSAGQATSNWLGRMGLATPRMGGAIGGYRDLGEQKAQEAYNIGRDPNSPSYVPMQPIRSGGLFGPSIREVGNYYDQGIARLTADQGRIESELSELNKVTQLKAAAQAAEPGRQAALMAAQDYEKELQAKYNLPSGAERAEKMTDEEAAKEIGIQNRLKEASKANAEYQKQLEKTGYSTEKVAEKEKELTNKRKEIENAQAAQEKAQKELKLKRGHAQGQAAGTALMLAGMGFNLASQAAAKKGNEEAAEALSTIGTATTTAGVGLSGLASIAGALGTSLSSVALVAGAVMAALAAIVGIGMAIYNASPEGQIKAAEKNTKEAEDAANSVADSYKELNNELQQVQDQRKNLKNITKGTKEWNKAVLELNQNTAELIDKNPSLAAFGEWEDGVFTLKDNVKKDVIDSTGKTQQLTLQEYMKQEQADSLMVKNAALQAKIEENNLRATLKVATSLDDLLFKKETVVGEASFGEVDKKVLDVEVAQELAKLVASGVLNDEQSIRDYLGEKGRDIGINQDTIDNLRSTGFELQALEYQNDIIRAQQSENIKQIADLYGTSSDFVQGLGSDFVSGFADYQAQTKAKDYKNLTREDYEKYAELMNWQEFLRINWSGQKGVFKNAQGGTERIDNATIAKKLAEQDKAYMAAMGLSNIENTLKTASRDAFSRMVSEEGEAIGAADFGEEGILQGLLTSENGIFKAEELIGTEVGNNLARTFSKTAETFEDWAKELGIDANELEKLIQTNAKAAANRIVDEREDLISKMVQYTDKKDFSGENGLYQVMSNTLLEFESKFGDLGREMLADVFTSLEMSGDDAVISSGWVKFMTQAVSMTESEARALANTIGSINWASPIDAADQLADIVKYGSTSAKEFAAHIQQTGSAFLSTGSQIRYLVGQSEEFGEISTSIEEIIDQNGKLAASDIYDLADQYKSLKKIMDNTGVSAGSLAEVLESVSNKELGLHQITDAVLASIAHIDELDSVIAGLNKDFSEFDAGIDENFASQFIGQVSEVFKSNLEKGAFGNSQLDSYMDYLFGDEWDLGLSPDERVNALKSAGDFYEENSENMSAAWADLAAIMSGNIPQGFLGKNFLKSGGDTTTLGFNISRNAATGEIELSGYDNLSVAQMAENMSEVFGITERMAQAFLTDYANYSTDFEFGLKNRQETESNIIDRAVQAAGTLGEKTIIDQSEIDAINQLNGTELTAEDFGGRATVTNFYDENGTVIGASDAWEQFANITGQTVGSFMTESAADISAIMGNQDMTDLDRQQALNTLMPTTLDMAELEDQLANSGLSEVVQDQIKAGMLESFADIDSQGRATQEYQVKARLSDGSIQEITVQAGQTYEEALNVANQQQQNDALAASLSEALISAASGITAITPTIDTAGIQAQLSQGSYSINISGVVTSVTGSGVSSGGGAGGGASYKGQKPHIGPSYASGLSSAKRTHAALTGELGPELIWRRSQNEFYLAGMHGPEMTTVNPADTVFTAEETKKILNQPDGPKMPGFAKGLSGPSFSNPPISSSGYGSAKKSGGKNANSDSKSQDWENPFDKLYNLLCDIDEELRERERLERRYEKLLEDLGVSANKIIDISREELNQLEKEKKLQEKLISGRKDQIKTYLEENEDKLKYANITESENGDYELRIDWDLIDSVSDKEEGEGIEKFVKQLEEWLSSIDEAEEALWDIEDTIEEIKDRGEDEYFDLEEAIKDAVEKSYKDQIDELKDINDAIDDANDELLKGIKDSIEKTRQDRENEKTEEELSDKQRRLSYLQMDTSGANAMEILQLQKEIEEGQEDYTDSLIDQKISELQEQNDEAAKQREKQIDLLQTQLDHYLETGRIWNEVYQLMEDGLDKDSGLIRGSRLEEILKNEENFAGLSVIGKQEWWTDMDKKVAQALSYLEIGRQIENLGIKNKEIEFYTEDGQKLKGKVDDKGNVTTADGTMYNNVYQGANGLYYAGKNYEVPKEPEVGDINKEVSSSGNKSGGNSGNSGPLTTYTARATYTEYFARGNQILTSIKTVSASSTRSQQDAQLKADQQAASLQNKTYSLAMARARSNGAPEMLAYASGGLADFTGPAWLDGTKSRPELILNQRDTQNFIQLKDILSSLFSHNPGNSSSTENNGDITYDIDINVESIGSDYDIDKVASRVKTLITEEARYRNNNSVSLKR